jgi:hypothetical protein
MGQRANLIVIEHGQRLVYYDHWCANRLDDELFWGPEEALHFIRQREPLGEEGWLDEVWCEGAAVLDLDRRDLLFFGGQDVLFDVRLRRVHLDLLRHQWNGWTVRWAPEGLMTILDELGMPREPFVHQREDDDLSGFRFHRAHPEDSDVLLTEQPLDGPLRLGGVFGTVEDLVTGPEALDVLLNGRFFGLIGGVPMRRTLRWHDNEFPVGGVHIDRRNKRLATWWASDTGSRRGDVERAWRGWSVDWMFDDFERHVALCGDALILPPFDECAVVQTILDRLEPQLIDSLPRNPAREIDIGGELSEWTDHSRGRQHSEAKREVFERLRDAIRAR